MRAREGGGVRPTATVALRPSDAPLGKGKARTLRAVPAGGAQRAVRRGSGGLGTTTTSLHSTAEKVSSRKPGFRLPSSRKLADVGAEGEPGIYTLTLRLQ